MRVHTSAQSGVSFAAFERTLFVGTDSGMNACVACCDRWADLDLDGLEWIGRDGATTVRGFAALRADAARFANLLSARGVRPGDVVAGMLPRGAEMLTVILGTWRAGAVYQPIPVGISEVAIEARINHTGRAPAKLVVTDMANRGTLGVVDYCPPVLVVANGARVRPGDGDFREELLRQPAHFTPVPRGGDDSFILLVGGRGGSVRPVMPKLRSMPAILTSIRVGLEPREADIGWDVTDPAWSFLLYFPVILPLLQGHAAIAYESDTPAPAIGGRAIHALSGPRTSAARDAVLLWAA